MEAMGRGRLQFAALPVVMLMLAAAAVPTAGAGAGRTVTAGAGWPVYGGDAANSRSSTSGPAPVAVGGLRRVWRVACGCGDITGTPVVGGGRVFVAGDGGRASALDETTGATLWTATLGGPVNSSAAFDASTGRLFLAVATVGSPYVVALDAATGVTLWRTVLTTQPGSDVYASPQLVGGDIVIGTSALFAETQQSRPAVHGTVSRLAGATGTVEWQTPTVAPGRTGGGVWATAAVDGGTGTVYVGTGNAYTPPADPHTDSVLALDAATGTLVHAFQATPNDVWDAVARPTGPDYDFGASPNLFTLPDGTPVVGEGQKSGVYWALRRTDLVPLWHTRVAPGSSVGGILGSTAVDAAHVYGPATEPAEVWALDHRGALSWVLPNAEPLKWSPVTVSSGVVYAASSAGLLQTWDAATGQPLAATALGAPAVGGVSIADGMVFCATGTSFGTGGSVEAFR